MQTAVDIARTVLMRSLRDGTFANDFPSVIERVFAETEVLMSDPEAFVQLSKLASLPQDDELRRVAKEEGQGEILDAILTSFSGLARIHRGPRPEFEPEPEIFDAIEDCDADRVRTALETWDVNARHGEFGKTALYDACSQMFGLSTEIIALLLDAGADPRLGLTGGGNVLHGLGFARIEPEDVPALADLVRRCVALGADLEEPTDKLQWTPLHCALTEWNTEATDALLRAGADPNARAGVVERVCTSGQSPLLMAMDRADLFGLVLDHGGHPDEVDTFGRSARSELSRLVQSAKDDNYLAELQACQSALDALDRLN